MAETINMPKLGFDMAEGTLVRWLKKTGETVNKGELLAEIETDKATVEVESSASGVVRILLVEEGAVVPVNTPIAVVGTADESMEAVAPQASQTSKVERQPAPVAGPEPVPVQSEITNRQLSVVRSSPLARRIASEKKVDLSNLKGSGPGGRIVRRDIEKALASQESPIAGRMVSAPPSSDYSAMRLSDQAVPLTKLRAAIGRRMAEAKTTIPHFYVTHAYKMDALLELRAQFNKIVPENEKLSLNDFIIKAVALTLLQFPNLNASLNGSSVLQHGHANIGVAVSVEGGLLTIVCRDPDQKPLRQIASEVKAMAARAREGKVKPDDIEGSTFSISNLGMYEVENFIAILNPPEAAILAVGSAQELAVVEGGVVKAGWRMKATISVDHRISDGAEAARFMQALRVFLEEPLRLMI
jgi:pyruvate dehydrogenase E2 component (dihydrolipoamide acetyltransferase)